MTYVSFYHIFELLQTEMTIHAVVPTKSPTISSHFQTKANFIIFDPVRKVVCYEEAKALFKRIRQPKTNLCNVYNQCIVTCEAPKQDEAVIEVRSQSILRNDVRVDENC